MSMEGMVWVESFNVIVLIPVLLIFVPVPFQHLFGFYPKTLGISEYAKHYNSKHLLLADNCGHHLLYDFTTYLE